MNNTKYIYRVSRKNECGRTLLQYNPYYDVCDYYDAPGVEVVYKGTSAHAAMLAAGGRRMDTDGECDLEIRRWNPDHTIDYKIGGAWRPADNVEWQFKE